MRILKQYHPEYVDKVFISESIDNGYEKKLTIEFPGMSGNLYPEISLYIRLVWGCDDVLATFDFDGTNYFSFNL